MPSLKFLAWLLLCQDSLTLKEDFDGSWVRTLYAEFKISSMIMPLSKIPHIHGGLGGHFWFLTRDLKVGVSFKILIILFDDNESFLKVRTRKIDLGIEYWFPWWVVGVVLFKIKDWFQSNNDSRWQMTQNHQWQITQNYSEVTNDKWHNITIDLHDNKLISARDLLKNDVEVGERSVWG